MDKIPILYINLNHRQDRNKQLIDELKKYNLFDNVERVEAIKHPNGYIGCVLSHIICLNIAIKKELEQVIILEDDFIFLRSPDILDLNLDYDIFLLGGTIWKKEDGIDKGNYYRVTDASRTEGYIIKKHYYLTLRNHWIESVSKLLMKHENNYCLDIYWKLLQKKDKFYMNKFGLIGGQRPGYSDIKNTKMTRPNNKVK